MKNRRTHITILIANLPAERDRRVIRECLTLEEAGYEVTVIAPRGDKSLRVLPGSRGTRLRPYPVFVYGAGVLSFAMEFVWSFLCIMVRLLGEILAGRAHAVQVCNPPDVYWPLALMLRAMGRPWVFDHHDLCPEVYATRSAGRPNRWVYRTLELLEWLTLRTASAVIATNESFRDNALRRGVSEEKVTVVRNGPALSEIAPPGQDDGPGGRHGEHHLVYVGVLGPQDNVEGAILAAEQLARIHGRAGWRLSIAGDGESLPALRKLVADRGLGDLVEFTGWLEGPAVDALLRSATVAIQPDLPTEMNNLSTMAKTVEYVARGLPVVAADLVETRRTAGDAASYVPNGTPSEYAEAIDELLGDRERRTKMREVGLARFTGQLAWDHQARSYIQVWHRLLAGRRLADSAVPRPRTGGPDSSRVTEQAGRE
ncbi:glycosyltransferase family 4 protein [Micromonospora sp. CPCC 206061]|uniref:glycosyltransferase family 4 protein n=1 Tax=Micromonospora sp. CPCC 206061 TaxID=3122410 RepID=UPI002FF3BCBD